MKLSAVGIYFAFAWQIVCIILESVHDRCGLIVVMLHECGAQCMNLYIWKNKALQ